MTTTITSLICNKFAGIRRIDARFSADVISCSNCQNIELFNTEVNSGVGIRTTKGNKSIYSSFANGEKVINIFKSVQDSTEYCFVHTETNSVGKIYSYASGVMTPLYSTLSVTGQSCGTDFSQGWNDLFMFSNGTEVIKIDMNAVTQATAITLTGTESESVTGIGFKDYDSRLWIFSGNRLWYSYKGDCTDFSTTNPTHTASAGYIEFSKNITAIYPYLGSLAVFHKDSSCLVSADSEDNFTVSDDSPGGCCGANALVFHGTDLYFYDDTKKGVFSFQQVVNGDKTLGQNIAKDIQDELINIDSTKVKDIKALSVVLEDRNEVWFLTPQVGDSTNVTIMIFDVIHGEWVKRYEPYINCFAIVNNQIYSGNTKLYEEYNGSDFAGTFIKSFYTVTPFNLGADNTLKILYFPPRLSLDSVYKNDFYVKYIKNYNFFKKAKIKRIQAKTLKNVLYWDVGYWDTVYKYAPNSCSTIIKFPSATFKTLEIEIYTEIASQEFCIRSVEFSKIKVKQI